MNTSVAFALMFQMMIIGVIIGWIAYEYCLKIFAKETHEFEALFEENPHPEIFDDDGNIIRKTYLAVNFDHDSLPMDTDGDEEEIIS